MNFNQCAKIARKKIHVVSIMRNVFGFATRYQYIFYFCQKVALWKV